MVCIQSVHVIHRVRGSSCRRPVRSIEERYVVIDLISQAYEAGYDYDTSGTLLLLAACFGAIAPPVWTKATTFTYVQNFFFSKSYSSFYAMQLGHLSTPIAWYTYTHCPVGQKNLEQIKHTHTASCAALSSLSTLIGGFRSCEGERRQLCPVMYIKAKTLDQAHVRLISPPFCFHHQTHRSRRRLLLLLLLWAFVTRTHLH